jgi:uncharacterized circularly permuted ATP-grasp superfamily protein
MQGISVASDIYAHIAGVDIVRAGQGEFYVLEDNLRAPSGVSYMLEDRKMMMRLFPELFLRHKIAPVAHYPDMLLDNLRSVASIGVTDPTVVVMTPGMYNSAYFEHAFLAQQMGGWNWSKARICSSTITPSTCAPHAAPNGST